MSDSTKNANNPPARKETRRQKWTIFLIFVGFSILEVSVLIFGDLRFAKSDDWIIVAGALFFPLMAAISWKSLRNNWSPNEADSAFFRVFGWIIAAPFMLAAVGMAAWILFSFFGWLATIPAWAAVIIILLLIRR